MDTKEKLLKAFEQFRPHINGHKTAIDLFFEGIKEVEDLQKQVKNCSIPDVMESVCSCSKGKGIDYDEDGKAYCIDCGNYLEQTVP